MSEPTTADVKTAREIIERYFPNPLPPGAQWRDAPIQLAEAIAAALAAQREELIAPKRMKGE